MEEVINESFLAYKNDCMFYLNLALNDFLHLCTFKMPVFYY